MNHILYRVRESLMSDEVDFWRALGAGRITRPEPKWVGHWMKVRMARPAGNLQAHFWLRLIPDNTVPILQTNAPVICFTPEYGLTATLNALNKTQFSIKAWEDAEWWGARRVTVTSPNGYQVSLLEYDPPAVWPGPPEEPA